MLIPISSKDIIRFTPSAYKDDPAAPVYILSVPTIAGKAKFHREMAVNGCKFHSDEEFIQMLREGVNAVIEESQRASVLETIDVYDLYRKEKKESAADLALEIANIEKTILQHYQPYAELNADRNFYFSMYPIILTSLFLKGWENKEPAFKKTGDHISEESINAISAGDLNEIGMKLMELMSPSGKTEKN